MSSSFNNFYNLAGSEYIDVLKIYFYLGLEPQLRLPFDQDPYFVETDLEMLDGSSYNVTVSWRDDNTGSHQGWSICIYPFREGEWDDCFFIHSLEEFKGWLDKIRPQVKSGLLEPVNMAKYT